MIKQGIKLPPDMNKALLGDPNTASLWNDLTPVSQRDFVTWIESAKQPETRVRRIGIAKSKLLSGHRRPCCYKVVPMSLYTALSANTEAKNTWKGLGSMARRDLASWIKQAKNIIEQRIRAEKVCVNLASGKSRL
jgi:uncharacterized protein YdeI (YjbR/CyaY-like superfamily)